MSKPLIPAQRRERIQEFLAANKIARTTDLCALLDGKENIGGATESAEATAR